jgi:capsular exopolysaccharide synthesis family protein
MATPTPTPVTTPIPQAPYYEGVEGPLDYKYYFFLLKKNLTLIVTFLIMGVTLVSIYVSRLPDEYRATAQVLLERPRGTGQAGPMMVTPDIWQEDYYNTQKEIMMGPAVLRQVVDEMKLVDRFKVATVDDAVERMKTHVTVDRIRQSRLFVISAVSADPRFSMSLANAVGRAYIRKNFEDLLYFSKEILGWLPQEGTDTITVKDPFGNVRQVTREELMETLPSIQTDPTVQALQEKKSNLQAEMTTLAKTYKEKHPLVVKNRASLNFIEESLKAERQRVVETLRQQAEGRLQVAPARIVEEAVLPKAPEGPDRPRLVLYAMGAELVVIFIFVFLWDYFDDTVHSPDDMRRKGVVLPFLGPVPLVKEFDAPEEERFLVTHYQRQSQVAESFRYLRVAINFSASPEALKTLVLTSSLPNEGKSFIAHNIAVSLAQDGNRTLLIDADLRKPVAQRVYRAENVTGLSNFLTSDIDLETVIRETFVENLSVILSGPVSPNPSEILGSKRMSHLLEVARERFDRIIIDAPPLTGIGDSLVLGSLTTHVILVVRSGKTPAQIIKESKEVLEKSGIHIIGSVLNQVDIDKERYRGYFKYYYKSYKRYYTPSAGGKR